MGQGWDKYGVEMKYNSIIKIAEVLLYKTTARYSLKINGYYKIKLKFTIFKNKLKQLDNLY